MKIPTLIYQLNGYDTVSTLEGLDMQMVRQAMLYGTIEDYI